MDCERTSELLPWLLNGTLDDGERRQVRDHLAACPACRAAWMETRRAGEIFAAHVPAADLVAYVGGEATALDRALIARHVADCAACADEVALLAESRRDLQREEGATVLPFPAGARRPALTAHRPWIAAAMAAGLVAALGLSGWVSARRQLEEAQRTAESRAEESRRTADALDAERTARRDEAAALERELGQLRLDLAARERAAGEQAQPRLAASALVTLNASSDVVRGAGAPEPPVLTGDRARLQVVLDPGAEDATDLEVLLSDARGRRLASLREGLAVEFSAVEFDLENLRQLAPGRYVVEVRGRSGDGRPRTVARAGFRVP